MNSKNLPQATEVITKFRSVTKMSQTELNLRPDSLSCKSIKARSLCFAAQRYSRSTASSFGWYSNYPRQHSISMNFFLGRWKYVKHDQVSGEMLSATTKFPFLPTIHATILSDKRLLPHKSFGSLWDRCIVFVKSVDSCRYIYRIIYQKHELIPHI